MNTLDDVRGVIIGDVTSPYEFWTTKPTGYPLFLGPQRFARGQFANDAEAEAWVKEHYPNEYAAGVEMRVFEGG